MNRINLKSYSFFFTGLLALLISALFHFFLATGFRIYFNDIPKSFSPKFYFLGSILKSDELLIEKNEERIPLLPKETPSIAFPFEWIAQKTSSEPKLNKPKVSENASNAESKEILKSTFDDTLINQEENNEPLGIPIELEAHKPLRLNP